VSPAGPTWWKAGPLDAAREQRCYVYRVWSDGVLVKDWTEGNMADFFGMLPEAGKE
jgi:hypothetical protein